MKKKDVNYSKTLIGIIDEGRRLMTEYSSDEVPSSQLTLALFGATNPVEAANIAIRYNGNDPDKAYSVVSGMISTVNMSQQGFLDEVVKIIDELRSQKSFT